MKRRLDSPGVRRALAANSGVLIAALVFAVLLAAVAGISSGPLTYFDISFMSSGGATWRWPPSARPSSSCPAASTSRRAPSSRSSTSSWPRAWTPPNMEANVFLWTLAGDRHRHAVRRLQRLLHRLPAAAADRRDAVHHVHHAGHDAAGDGQAGRLRLALASAPSTWAMRSPGWLPMPLVVDRRGAARLGLAEAHAARHRHLRRRQRPRRGSGGGRARAPSCGSWSM